MRVESQGMQSTGIMISNSPRRCAGKIAVLMVCGVRIPAIKAAIFDIQ
jgi:hypothetical protein